MPLDPSIILQAGKGVTPLLSQAEIDEQRMQREIGGMKLQQAKQGIADDQALRQVYSQGGDIGSALQQRGLYKPAMEYRKFQSEQQKAKADRGKAAAEGMKQGANMILANPTEENAIRTLTETANLYGLPQEMVDSAKARIYQARNDPNQLRQLAAGWGADAEKVLGEFKSVNMGATQEQQRVNPVTGQLEVAGVQQRTQSPESVASIQQSNLNNQRSVGAAMSNADARRDIAAATRDAATIKRNQDTEMKLADDYRKQSKDFKDVGDAYRLISSTLDSATKSPAATLAAATKFMKLLDPGSVVRESELGMALQASGVFDRLTNYHNTLLRGKVLTANQVQDFKKITQDIYAAAQEGQKLVDADYAAKAEQYGLRPEMITQDFGQNKQQRPSSKTISISGKEMRAELAPDGKYYVQQNGKWAEVVE